MQPKPKTLNPSNKTEAMVPGDRVICFECRKEPARDGKALGSLWRSLCSSSTEALQVAGGLVPLSWHCQVLYFCSQLQVGLSLPSGREARLAAPAIGCSAAAILLLLGVARCNSGSELASSDTSYKY